jgi:glycerol-3-phosphate dehydrogenase (NAD(P)+)
MASPRDTVAIVGAGRMGCALATWVQATDRGRTVLVWDRSSDVRARLAARNVPAEVGTVADLASLPSQALTIFLAVPAGAVEPVARAMADDLEPDHRIVLVAKGVDPLFRRASKVVHDVTCVRRIAVLGGPLVATEIAAGQPQAIVVASGFDAVLGEIRALLERPRTWLVGTHDLPGVEIAGAMRNVSSIAVGIAEAQGLSEASRALILTRGLLDAVELGQRLGAQAETFYGLCGVGDLVARREVSYSRNFRLGLRMGEGMSLERALADVTGEPEGITSARAARAYAERKGLSAVVARAVAGVMEGASPGAALEGILGAGFPTAPLLAGAPQ